MFHFLLAFLGALPEARAQSLTGDYLNLGFTGDGETPSALERFAASQPKTPPPHAGGVGRSNAGDASWGTSLVLPPARTWTHTSAAGAILGSQTYELGFTEGGRLELKKFDPEPLTYTYDGLGRIARVVEGVPATGANLETYTRDPAGNPTQVRIRDGGGTLRTWTYAATVKYNEIPSRALSGGATDTFTYQSPSGRLATWNTSGGGPQRTFAYDGSGRSRTASGEAYHYDVDDGIVLETRVGGVTIHRHDGWEKRQQVANGAWEVTESVLPMAALRGGALVVLRKEPDGHALQTHTPTTSSQEALGAFGLRLSGLQSNPDTWVVDGFHGEEVNRSAEVVHKGARHLALRDGMWLQPEPLLYLGLTNGNLRAPLGYSGVYAAGDSNHLHDRSGYASLALILGGMMAGHDVQSDFAGAASDPATYAYAGGVVVAGSAAWAGAVVASPAAAAFATEAHSTVLVGLTRPIPQYVMGIGTGAAYDTAGFGGGPTGGYASRSGTATVFWKGGHASIETRGASGALHTDQAVGEAMSTTGALADDAMMVNPRRSVTIDVPDVGAAQARQRATLGADLGTYDQTTNSCVTYCGDVLNAGGVPIDTSSSSAAVKDILKAGQ